MRCRDAVDFDRNLYLKEVTVEDVTGQDRDVRLFQHFDAHLWGNDIGDSAFYDPRTRAIVHYKGRRYFLMTGVNAKGESGLTSFAIGLKEALGREGTWRDAEDGELSRNLVAQGSIDSVGMLALHVPANGLATATFVIAVGQTYDEVRDLDKLVRERGVGSFLSRTGDYWNLWANKDETIAEHLPEPLIHPVQAVDAHHPHPGRQPRSDHRRQRLGCPAVQPGHVLLSVAPGRRARRKCAGPRRIWGGDP